MKMLFIAIVFLGLHIPVVGQPTNKIEAYYDSNGYVDLQKITVQEFVKILRVSKIHDKTAYILVTINEAKPDWISLQDIERLIPLLNSTQPAYCVMQMISSQFPVNGHSTLGGQVMNLIDSYRFQKPYPFFLTDCAKTEEERKQEILAWWKEHKK
jgi:hypothetical protein